MPNYNAYEINGIHYPSVTRVISTIFDKPALVYWFKKTTAEKAVKLCLQSAATGKLEHEAQSIVSKAIAECDTQRDAKGNVGAQLHRLIERELLGSHMLPHNMDEGILPRFECWHDWSKDQSFGEKDKRFIELNIWSEKLGFAGKGDYFGPFNNKKIAYIDWKFSNYFDKDRFPIQAGAYTLAFEERYNLKVDGLYGWHCQETEKGSGIFEPKLYDYSEQKEDLKEAFKASLFLWRYLHRNSRKFKAIINQEVFDESPVKYSVG